MDHRPWTAAGPAADDTGPDGTVTPELTGAQGPIALVAANLFVVSFDLSWGPMVWAAGREVPPPDPRGCPVAGGRGAVGRELGHHRLPPLTEGRLPRPGLSFYAVCALLPLVFVWKWVEETRGKELEDMHSEAVESV